MSLRSFLSLAICAVFLVVFNATAALAEEHKGDEITAIISEKTLFNYNLDDRKDVVWYCRQGHSKTSQKQYQMDGKMAD